MNIFKLSSLCLLTVILSACNSGGNNDNDKYSDNGGDATNELTVIGNVSADGEPVQIYDPEGLKQDIVKLFGDEDDDPLAVDSGETDTLQTVIDRGGRG